jgi:L-proline amide hydrolase
MTNEAENIQVPTLVIRGEFDEAQNNVVKPWVSGIKDVREEVIQGGSHTAHLELPWEYVGVMERFLSK